MEREAFERARSAYGTGAYDDATLEFVFPQLRESEDERIRRKLVEYHRQHFEKNRDQEIGFFHKDAITYLEKQKEQKPKRERNKPKESWLEKSKYELAHEEELLIKRQKELSEVRALKEKEQKPAEWSDNDDQLIGFIFDLLNDLVWRKDWAMSKEECLERLKSIRPVKREWSEEDENRLNAVMELLENTSAIHPNYSHRKLIIWLKSLRPSWKPSEEQMEAFRSYIKDFQEKAEAAVGGWNNFDVMIRLFEQLKKLM